MEEKENNSIPENNLIDNQNIINNNLNTNKNNQESIKDIEELETEIMPDDFNIYDLSFKIIVIGDSNVGKSCITLKATRNYFEESYSPTIGFEFFTLTIKINKQYVKLQIWDTCGQEAYRSLISSFYKNSSLAILTYSIDNENSFNNLNNWLNELKTESSPDIKIFLIGNKIDLIDKKLVLTETAQKFADDNNISLFLETSAKTGLNIKNVFIEAAKILYLEHIKYKDNLTRQVSLNSLIPNSLSIKSSDDKGLTKKSKCCF
jgi:small GTP-binding protein